MDGTGKLFQPFVEEFHSPDDVTVISYPIDRFLPYEKLVDYVISLLPRDKPLIILGESYSGPVALSLAAKDNLNIHGLILVATFAKYPIFILKILSKVLPLSLLFRLPIPDFIIRRYCFAEGTTKSLNDMLRDSIKANKPNILAKRAYEGATIDVTGLLSKINVPCLSISASNDKIVSKNAAEYLNAYIHDVKSVTITGSHFILQTQPKACFEIVQQWLR